MKLSKASGKMVKQMDSAFIFIIMEIEETIVIEKEPSKGKECITMQTEEDSKENLKIITEKVREFKNIQREIFLKVNGDEGKRMVLVCAIIKMAE